MAIASTAALGINMGAQVYGAEQQKKSADKATAAQKDSADKSIALQEKQFDAMKALLEPYVNAGTPALAQLAEFSNVAKPALEAQMALAGLGGAEAQKNAISQIESSPLFQSQIRQGEDALLQNASATGGLRGGNTQSALSQFRPAMLNQLIDKQYNRLGGLTQYGTANVQNLAQLGQSAATGTGSAGLQSANAIGNQLTNIGNAQAQNALVRGQANANLANNIVGSIGQFAGFL